MRHTWQFGWLAVVPAALLSGRAPAVAQEPEAGFEYASKIVCGVQGDPKGLRLARGLYATTINVHNPNDEAVVFSKKLALTFPPPEQKPGKIIPISQDRLEPDEALKVDCEDLQARFGIPGGGYIEGFVVIVSPASLDVTAVYTTGALDRGGFVLHSSIDVEQVRERRREPPRLPDLVPVPDPQPGVGFCRRDGSTLQVTVRNQGTAPAGPSTTIVEFFAFGSAAAATPGLGPGDSTDVFVTIPFGCFNPDCEFRISVDDADVVPESDETNNKAEDLCRG